MKLSIIIPVYNAAPYLKRCLDSIPVSDDVEVIVIDDGSTDESWEIMQEYGDRFHVGGLAGSNYGVSFARNFGINRAKGNYITFLDADDYYMPGAVETMLKITEQCSNNIIQFNDSRPQHSNLRGLYSLNNLPKKWVLCWNKCYKREFLIENEIRFPEGVTFEEDRAFNIICFHYCGEIFHTGKQTVNKCFDNKKSICHTVTIAKLISSAEALHQLAKEEDNPQVLQIIRRCLEELWGSKSAYNLMGGT